MKFFAKLDQLIEFYKKENMGLVTHLQYPVPLEEEDAGDEPEEETGRKGQRAGALFSKHHGETCWGVSLVTSVVQLSGGERVTQWLGQLEHRLWSQTDLGWTSCSSASSLCELG